MKYRAVIFDLDGVICSTDYYHYLAWKKVADEEGIYFDEEINNRLRGVSRMESLEIILEKYNGSGLTEQEKLAMASKKNEYYKELLVGMTPENLSVEVKDTLFELRSRGLLLAIGSSSKNTKYILERIGLGDFFDKISDGTNITKSKPDPEVFLKAAQYLEVVPSQCLVVEDAVSGVMAARAAGMDVAAVGDAFVFDKATYKINNFYELLSIADDNPHSYHMK